MLTYVSWMQVKNTVKKIVLNKGLNAEDGDYYLYCKIYS
jgi:hypothetical protein